MLNLEPSVSLDQFTPGSTFIHYRLLERIGHGGEADVWSAWDSHGKRIVAVKLIAPSKGHEVPSPQFNTEARLIARLAHANIVPLYDYGEWSSLRFLAMRFMVNGTLLSVLRQGPLPLPLFAEMAQAIADALDFVHDSEIVHRDLKPGNVLLDSRQSPFLTDFGLARQLSVGSTVPIHSPEGTLPYMSPEQLRGEIITAQSDLFSLGVMLFEMLTGQLPIGGKAVLAVHQSQTGIPIEDPIQYCPSLPEGTVHVLRRLTANRPADRPPNATECVRQLIALLDMTPIKLSGPFHSQTEDALDMLGEALNTWTPAQEQYPFSLTKLALIAAQCNDEPAYPLFAMPQSSQILLYGALHYQREVDIEHWWNRTPEDLRREVCWALILRIGDAPEIPAAARILAQSHQIVPDGSLPANVQARLIGLVQADLDPISRQALDLLVRWSTPSANGWRRSKTDVDSLLVQVAGMSSPLVPAALQAIVETHSASALYDIMALANRKLARQAITVVRDAGRPLPPGIPWLLQAEVLLRIATRQLTARPLSLLADYFWLALPTCLDLAFFLYLTRRTGVIFSGQRLFNALAPGLLFGLEIALGLFVAQTIVERLRILPAVVRVILGTLLGGAITTWAFANIHVLFYDIPPDSPLLLPGALIFTFGFALGGLFRRPFVRSIVAAVGVLTALLLTWWFYLDRGDAPLLYFEYFDSDPFLNACIPALLLALFIGVVSQYGRWWLRLARGLYRQDPKNFTKISHT
jgi:serine/threonine protein kinase